MECGIAIIGGGASGMAAAIAAARITKGVCLIEAQPRVGRKLLATGNGRCNITNSGVSASCYQTDCPQRLEELFGRFPYDKICGFLESTGISLVCEEEGRMYPRSGQASSVLDMLRYETERLGVQILCEAPVSSVKQTKSGFLIKAGENTVSAKRVIFAGGSKAAPQLGGDDSCLRVMKALGHSATPLRPSLVPLKCNLPQLRSLKGVRVRCKAEIICKGNKVHGDYGEVQFGDMLISGIVIFQLTSRMGKIGEGDTILSLDLMPDMSKAELAAQLVKRRNALGHLPLESFLSGLFNKKIGICLMKQITDLPLTESAEKLNDKQLEKLAGFIKAWSFTVSGTASWQQAQVMSGGIRLAEFDSGLQSRIVRGAYACGEILDVSGECGGFNLHWAWLSGIAAGEAAAKSLNGK